VRGGKLAGGEKKLTENPLYSKTWTGSSGFVLVR